MKPEEALKQVIGNGEGGKAYLDEYVYDGEVGSIYDAMELYANQKDIKFPDLNEVLSKLDIVNNYHEASYYNGITWAIEEIKQLNQYKQSNNQNHGFIK